MCSMRLSCHLEGIKLCVKLMTLKKRFLGGDPVLISVIFVFHGLYHVELALQSVQWSISAYP